MAMLATQQMITNAFSPRSLAGLRGFDTGGCGCGSLSGCGNANAGLQGLDGWWDDLSNWFLQTEPTTPADTGETDLCLDESNWTYVKYNDGTCATICGARTAIVDCAYTSYGGAKTPPPASVTTKLKADLAAKPGTPPVTTVSGNLCDDTSLWLVKKGVNGKCYNYCSADIENTQNEIDAKFCQVGQDMTGKKDTGLPSLNWMLIGGIGLAMLFAMRD